MRGLKLFSEWNWNPKPLVEFPGGSVIKNLPAKAGDTGEAGLIPGSGRFPGGGNSNPLQYYCWENPVHRGAWWAIVQGVTQSPTQLNTHKLKKLG